MCRVIMRFKYFWYVRLSVVCTPSCSLLPPFNWFCACSIIWRISMLVPSSPALIRWKIWPQIQAVTASLCVVSLIWRTRKYLATLHLSLPRDQSYIRSWWPDLIICDCAYFFAILVTYTYENAEILEQLIAKFISNLSAVCRVHLDETMLC